MQANFLQLLLIIVLCVSSCESTKQADESVSAPSSAPADNSRNSLDWPGTYRGTLPCADCAGIRTELVLLADGRFSLTQQYLGKSGDLVQQAGDFAWDALGSRIRLGGDSALHFLVGEGALHKLDLQGERIRGALAAAYVLQQKQLNQSVTGKYWQLVALPDLAFKSTLANQQQPHLQLLADENRAVGSGGCNGFTGTYTLAAEKQLQFGALAATEMYCLEGMEVEDAFFAALQACRSYRLDASGDSLILLGDEEEALASFFASYFHP